MECRSRRKNGNMLEAQLGTAEQLWDLGGGGGGHR